MAQPMIGAGQSGRAQRQAAAQQAEEGLSQLDPINPEEPLNTQTVIGMMIAVASGNPQLANLLATVAFRKESARVDAAQKNRQFQHSLVREARLQESEERTAAQQAFARRLSIRADRRAQRADERAARRDVAQTEAATVKAQADKTDLLVKSKERFGREVQKQLKNFNLTVSRRGLSSGEAMLAMFAQQGKVDPEQLGLLSTNPELTAEQVADNKAEAARLMQAAAASELDNLRDFPDLQARFLQSSVQLMPAWAQELAIQRANSPEVPDLSEGDRALVIGAFVDDVDEALVSGIAPGQEIARAVGNLAAKGGSEDEVVQMIEEGLSAAVEAENVRHPFKDEKEQQEYLNTLRVGALQVLVDGTVGPSEVVAVQERRKGRGFFQTIHEGLSAPRPQGQTGANVPAKGVSQSVKTFVIPEIKRGIQVARRAKEDPNIPMLLHAATQGFRLTDADRQAIAQAIEQELARKPPAQFRPPPKRQRGSSFQRNF